MTYRVVFADTQSCKVATSKQSTYTINGATILSVGFQNLGNAQSFYASQIFPISANQAYIQVVNNGLTNTDFRAVFVISTNNSLSEDKELKVQTVELSEQVVLKE